MTAHSSDAVAQGAEQDADEDRSRPRQVASTVASFNENGTLGLLAGGVLVVLGARSLARADRRGRGVLQTLAGVALVALGLRKRRSASDQGAGSGDDVSSEAAAHREQSTVHHQDETNPRGTSGEPDIEEQTDAGNVEFTEEQDLESGRKPGMADEADSVDPRSSDDAEVDLSEASMADEASEAAGPSSTQAQPAQTDTVEPERSPGEDGDEDEDDETTKGDGDADGGSGTDGEPDPGADPGEATAEAEAAEPAGAAEEAIEGEIDDPDREGVETEGGATVHTDTNESDSMDIDVDDVTDPDDDLNTEPADSEEQSSSHLDDDPPDEEADDEEADDDRN